MAQLYGCTSANGLWVVPGSHRRGKADIKAMVAAAGSDRLPDAVPLVCEPGDVAITNRQAVHGSFANTSPRPRVTINFGFHRRRSVLGVESGGVHNAGRRLRRGAHRRALEGHRLRHRRPGPALPRRASASSTQPFAGREDEYRWTPATLEALRDYNLLDLGI